MVKTEKKKYTKKNITNKIHKSKKNSGTAKKKAFRKSKKVGGLLLTEKPTIETNVNRNKKLFNEEMTKPAKKRNLNNMKKYVDNINKGIAQLKTLEKHYRSDTELVDRVSATNLRFFYEQLKETEKKQATTTSSSPSSEKDIKKPTQLDPLPPCWKQDFEKIDGKYTTKRFYVRDDGRISYQRPNSNEPCPKDVKEASNNTPSTTLRSSKNSKRPSKRSSNSNDFETLLARSERVKKEAEERQKERARLEQRIKNAKAEAEAAKAKRLELEKAAKEKAAKEKAAKEKAAKEKEEKEEKEETWRNSDATWKESYKAGK